MGTRYAGEKPNKKGEWVPVPTPKPTPKKATSKPASKAAAPKVETKKVTRSGGRNYATPPR